MYEIRIFHTFVIQNEDHILDCINLYYELIINYSVTGGGGDIGSHSIIQYFHAKSDKKIIGYFKTRLDNLLWQS